MYSPGYIHQRAKLQESLARLDDDGGAACPKMVVFDLDYTLWPAWVDTHVTPPLKRAPPTSINRVADRHGEALSFFPHVPAILLHLKDKGIKIGVASRTSAPSAARQALTGLVLEDTRKGKKPGEEVKSIALFDYQEIYPGSKLTHLKRLHADSGIAYEDMIFFDDEHRNSEVGKLGVLFVLVGHPGLDLGTFEKGIREWRQLRQARAEEGHAGTNGTLHDHRQDSDGE
ncbi:magnesium-dependent phosphatase-1 [Tilletiaria anomala UBC 951]|uniref:Magnesium-dependent phosphatase-1 n=1 Tax=Tilletiaria anomala (strain ATCC 24038 / CBS 436.72 / UBC 951) TaxID=1037660 RepID=A0A066WG18_TILAU|nr:magnesium-dependent phosphatase-1 [Tilletiaria anomala UBC 951]KDN52736.1 magnesium-dependent phosphatase-1 [Tilletiaria anomala UBC 951]